MKPLLNDILMLIYNDGSQRVYTVPFGRKAEEAYMGIEKVEDIDRKDIKKFHFFSKTK